MLEIIVQLFGGIGLFLIGMILMTEDTQGKLVFMNPDTAGVKNGGVIS